MPKKIKNCFYEKLTFQKLIEAHNRARKGKNSKSEVLKFDINLESNIISIMNDIKNNTYKVGNYYSFTVHEPKVRVIHSLPYRDRVIHQWYVEEFIKPYILPRLISTSFACLPEKGTHKAVFTLQDMMRKYKRNYTRYYILKCDIKKYFNSIDVNVLIKILEKYISDKALLNFSRKIILENRPFNTVAGIPIGNYSSQYFANIYLNELDQFVKRELHIHEYVRYMDDFIFLQKDKQSCIELKETISNFLGEKLHLELNNKSRYFPDKMGVNFCGYRIFPTHRLLRNSSKTRIKNKVKKWNKKYAQGRLDIPHTLQCINSWLGHSSYANSYTLQKKIINKCDFLINDNTDSVIENNLIEDINSKMLII